MCTAKDGTKIPTGESSDQDKEKDINEVIGEVEREHKEISEAKKEKGFPRTAKAQVEAQLVVDTMDDMTGKKTRQAVSAITHHNGTVSVAYSTESENDPFASQLENKLNSSKEAREFAKQNGIQKYTVSRKSMPVELIEPQVDSVGNPIGNKPGVCAEPRVADVASENASPIEGMDVVWRGKGENPHQFTGENADGTQARPNQMAPCIICEANMGGYVEHANGNKDSNP